MHTSLPAINYKDAEGIEKLARFFWDYGLKNTSSEDEELSPVEKINEKLVYSDMVRYSAKDSCIYYIAYDYSLWKYDINGKNVLIANDVEKIELSTSGTLYFKMSPQDTESSLIYKYTGKKSKKITPSVGIYELASQNGRVYYSDSTEAAANGSRKNAYGTYTGANYYFENKDGSFTMLYTAQ